MRRWQVTLIIVAVFAALLAYVLLVEVKRPARTEADAATPTPMPLPLLNLTAGDIRALQISDGERLLRLEQIQDGWQVVSAGSGLVEPEPGAADPYIVFISVDELARLQAGRVLLDSVADSNSQSEFAGQYGLDPARLTLIVVQRSGMERRLRVGKLTADAMWYYVQMEGDDRLYLVRQYMLEAFFTWLDQPPYLTGE